MLHLSQFTSLQLNEIFTTVIQQEFLQTVLFPEHDTSVELPIIRNNWFSIFVNI